MAETVQERETVLNEISTAVRHSAVYGLGSVLAKVVGFAMLPFYTHYLAPRDYGILEVLDLSMSLFGMFLAMGMTASILRSHAKAETPDEKRKVVSTAFICMIVTGVAVYAIGMPLVPRISASLLGPNVPATFLRLSFTSFVLGYINNLPRTYLRALEASGVFTFVETGSLALMLGLNVYFIAVRGYGPLGVLLSAFIVCMLQLIVLSGWALRRLGFHFSVPHLRQMVSFGWPLMFSNLAVFTLNFSDRFFLQHLLSLEVVGVYAVGYKFAYMINYLLVQPFYVMWQTRMYMIYAAPNHARIFRQIFVLYVLLLTFAGLGMSMFSPEITRFMAGPKFLASQEVIPVVVLAYLFWGIGFYVQVGMYVTNNTRLIGMVSAAAAVLNLVLNYFLITYFGMLGAAWATVISFFAIAAGSYWFSQRVMPLSLGAPRVAAGLAIGIAIYLASRFAPLDLLTALTLKAGLLCLFPLLLWKLRILSADELSTLAGARRQAAIKISRMAATVSGRTVRV
jgi:O-antigen/teichoic acid export membrane protein